MFIAVRCPLCLLTVYTIFVDNGPNLNGFSVMSLADEDLPFYNCPMPLCGFHIPTFHFVNLYLNPTIKHLKHSISMGLNVAARTNDTRPFRSPSQVAALAITLDRDERQKPPVVAWQAQVTKGQPLEGQPLEEQPLEEQPLREQPLKEQPLKERPLREQPLEEQHIKEQPPQEQPPEAQPLEEQPLEEQPAEKQASQDIGHRDSQGGAAMPAVADTITPKGTKWTDAEVEKLTSLNDQGLAHVQIANEMNRSILSVRYKLGTIREKERLNKTKI